MDLQQSLTGTGNSSIAPKSGIDNLSRDAYRCSRRWLKGLAKIKRGEPEVGWAMGKPGQLGELPNPKKPTVLRGSAGVWNCESSDRIEGRDGACLHVVGSLAGAGG
jgi:hypothetical protein